MQFKTKTAAISHALLQGEVITIMDGFKRFAVTNLPREIGRQIRDKFGVVVSSVRKDYVTPGGHSGYYFEYRLNKTPMNKEGVKKMWDYVNDNLMKPPKTSVYATPKQADLFNL